MIPPRKNTLNWYKYDISFSIELMESYTSLIESQAEELYKNFEKFKNCEILEEVPEENYARIVVTHQGLNDETWDLNGIFSDYFPSLQRRSALITLCSYFESELDKLCILFKNEKSLLIDLADINNKGIERSTCYLEKVVGIKTFKNTQVWNEIRIIHKLRNVFVHQNGEIINAKKEVIDFINRIDSLKSNNEIIIYKGFLSFVVNIYKNYFKILNESILSYK
jgi:hypothetical protein